MAMFKNHLHDMQNPAQINYKVLEDILLDLHYDIARLAWLLQEYLLYPSLQEQVHLVEVNSDNGIFHIFLIYNYN